MNGRRSLVMFLMLGGAAWGAPVPPPPEGFAGSQYIDASGCVFAREGSAWVARMVGGQQLCGFPPSLEARRQDATADRVLPLTPPPRPDPETLLLEQLADDLRPGEWKADPRQAEIRADPAPARHADPVELALRDAVAVAPALQAAGGIRLSPEVCAQLGYSGQGKGDGAGLCPGAVSEPRLAARPAGIAPVIPAKPAPAAKPARAAPPKAVPKPAQATRRAGQAPAAAAASQSASAPAAPKTATPPAAEMIPPSARYVQVGAYTDEENALIVLRALSTRGYKTGQTRTKGQDKAPRVIMAGPFADRQSLIAALNDLRANGYPAAVAR